MSLETTHAASVGKVYSSHGFFPLEDEQTFTIERYFAFADTIPIYFEQTATRPILRSIIWMVAGNL